MGAVLYKDGASGVLGLACGGRFLLFEENVYLREVDDYYPMDRKFMSGQLPAMSCDVVSMVDAGKDLAFTEFGILQENKLETYAFDNKNFELMLKFMQRQPDVKFKFMKFANTMENSFAYLQYLFIYKQGFIDKNLLLQELRKYV